MLQRAHRASTAAATAHSIWVVSRARQVRRAVCLAPHPIKGARRLLGRPPRRSGSVSPLRPPAGGGTARATRSEVRSAAAPIAAKIIQGSRGRRIALVRLFQDASGTEGIWLRDLNGTAPYLLAGTENASSAFWSPDGCCLGFMAQGKLKTVNVSGGPANLVSNAPRGRGGAWNEAGTVLFAPVTGGPLHSVPDKGGAEHYGNIVTYMRANGLVPPSSEGR